MDSCSAFISLIPTTMKSWVWAGVGDFEREMKPYFQDADSQKGVSLGLDKIFMEKYIFFGINKIFVEKYIINLHVHKK